MKNIIDICNENTTNSIHSLYEASILDIDGTLAISDEDIVYTKEMIRSAICQIYKIAAPKYLDIRDESGVENAKHQFSVNYNRDVVVKDKTITSLNNGYPFIWHAIGKNFDFSGCKSLTSLNGMPYAVGGDIICKDCGIKFTKWDIKRAAGWNGRFIDGKIIN
jgi:hypothetical protein